MTAWLFRLVLGGGGRRLGKLCSLGAAGRAVGSVETVPLAFLVSSVALRARSGGIGSRGGVPARDPAPVPVRVLDQDPSIPLDCLGPEGRLGFKRAVRRLLPGGQPAVGTRSVAGRGAAGWSAASRSSPNASPNRRGILGSIAAPTNGPVRAVYVGGLLVSVLGPVVEQEARGETPRWAVRVLTGGDRPGWRPRRR